MYCLICKITYSAKFLYIESKYLTLIPVSEREKGSLIKYKEMFDKIKYLIKVKNNNSDDFDDKNIRSIFNGKKMILYSIGFRMFLKNQLNNRQKV